MMQLRNLVADIHHVGGTAVLHMMASPVLDILITVKHPDDVERCVESLRHLGYRSSKGDNLFLMEREAEPPCRLIILTEDHPQCEEILLFRDALRSYPRLRSRYELLRMNLLRRCSSDPCLCQAVREEFMRSAIEKYMI